MCVVWNHPSPRSNCARSQKRAVLYIVMSYSLIWALTWILLFILFFAVRNKATHVLQTILQPLQGFYNLIVYMSSPKVRNARNKKRGQLPWRQSLAKAWMSKGEMSRRAISTRRHTKTASMRPTPSKGCISIHGQKKHQEIFCANFLNGGKRLCCRCLHATIDCDEANLSNKY